MRRRDQNTFGNIIDRNGNVQLPAHNAQKEFSNYFFHLTKIKGFTKLEIQGSKKERKIKKAGHFTSGISSHYGVVVF